jgi:hypothetical protein
VLDDRGRRQSEFGVAIRVKARVTTLARNSGASRSLALGFAKKLF